MTTRVLKTEDDRDRYKRLVDTYKLPCTVSVVKGQKRSDKQNRTQRLWYNEAAEQLADETAEEKRAYCKLHFGVPILRNEVDAYQEAYDRIVRPLEYEQKLEIMAVPLDFHVTRIMTTSQHKKFLDAVWNHFRGQGVDLSDPEELMGP